MSENVHSTALKIYELNLNSANSKFNTFDKEKLRWFHYVQAFINE